MKNPFQISGPGVLIAAAFIGPGTVTICTLAGVQFGYALLWALVLSMAGTIVLQEMAARIGLVSGKGLAAVIREQLQHPVAKALAVTLILSAIVIGNGAYEAGNISGGVLGIEALGLNGTITLGTLSVNLWSWALGGMAALLLYLGSYKLLERVLVSLVLVMSVAFVITSVLAGPPILALLKGILVPSIPSEGLLMVVGLIGTTIVPYNLFLHASLVGQKWSNPSDLPAVRRDTIVAIVLGGLVSMCIVIAAAALQGSEVLGAVDLARSLEPLLGDAAHYFIGLGLGAAGLTSAITAPLAAAYVVKGCLGWEVSLKSARFRAVWAVILLFGVLFSSLGYRPITVIKFAQVANGILLPIIAGYLLWIVNQKTVLGSYVNSRFQNVVGIFIWIIVLGLSLRSLLKVFGIL